MTRNGPKEEPKSTEQEQWATQIREISIVYRRALFSSDNPAISHQPAPHEWSAIEVVGQMIDKMQIWTSRSERIKFEERPALSSND